MIKTDVMTGYPSKDRPWLKYYSDRDLGDELPSGSLYEYLWECNKDHLENTALNYFGRKITFGKLFSMIDEAARAFISIGVREGEIVPVLSLSTVTAVVCFYALNRIGAVSDYLNVLSEEKDLADFFEEAHAATVVTMDLFGEKVVNAARRSRVKTVITFGMDLEMPVPVRIGYRMKVAGKVPKIVFDGSVSVIPWKDFLDRADETKTIDRHKDPDTMCFLAHTGGTTGIPKAVMLSDRAMNAVVYQYIGVSGINRGEVFLNLIVPFVVYGILSNVHLPLCIGLENVLIPKFDANDWYTYFRQYRPNHVLAAPSYVIPMMNDPKVQKMDLSFFVSVGVGGDGMTAEIEKAMNDFYRARNSRALVLKGYGMTEVCSTAVVGFSYSNRIGSAGIPLPFVDMMIYDRDRQCELGYNEVGEICLRSPSRMLGYLNNDEATGELFWIHPDGSEWLHTEDLGYIDEDGFLFLAGRMKRVILTTGDGICYKVFPNVPEEVLDSHDSVVQSCVVGAMNGQDQVLRAYISVKDEDMSLTEGIESELRDLCDSLLPAYSRPTFYVFRNALPLTPSGKVDYRILEKESDGPEGGK